MFASRAMNQFAYGFLHTTIGRLLLLLCLNFNGNGIYADIVPLLLAVKLGTKIAQRESHLANSFTVKC